MWHSRLDTSKSVHVGQKVTSEDLFDKQCHGTFKYLRISGHVCSVIAKELMNDKYLAFMLGIPPASTILLLTVPVQTTLPIQHSRQPQHSYDSSSTILETHGTVYTLRSISLAWMHWDSSKNDCHVDIHTLKLPTFHPQHKYQSSKGGVPTIEAVHQPTKEDIVLTAHSKYT